MPRLRPIAVLAALATVFTTTVAVPAAQAATVTAAAGQYMPLVSARIQSNKTIGKDGTLTFSPLGLGGVPSSGVSAVALQVHALAAGVGWLQVYPAATTRPAATSTVNYDTNVAADNAVVTGLGTNNQISIYNGGANGPVVANVDVVGYYTAAGVAAGSNFVPLQPSRIVSGTATTGTTTTAGTLTVSPLGAGGIPASGVTAVVASVSVDAKTPKSNPGTLTAYPALVTKPATVTDFAYGNAESRYTGQITVKLGTNGKFVLATTSLTNLYVEVEGYFQTDTTTGSVFTPVTPSRVIDHETVADGETGYYKLSGEGGVPSNGVSAVAFNLTGTATAVTNSAGTVTEAAVAGALSVNAADQDLPVARQVSYHVGSHWPVQQISQISTDGYVAIHNTAAQAQVTLLGDVTGYYAPYVTRISRMPWSSGVGPQDQTTERADQFADFRGTKLDNVVVFAPRDSWTTLSTEHYYTDILPTGFNADRDDLVATVPLWPGDHNVTNTGTQAEWEKLATTIAGVDANAYVRLGWEMNLASSYWMVGDGTKTDYNGAVIPDNQAKWQSDFIDAVTWMKGVAPGLRFVWNPNKGDDQTCTDCTRSIFQAAKSLIDVYGIDSYDAYPPDTDDATRTVHLDYLLGESMDYAYDNGKKFAVPEWGISCNATEAGHDNCNWAGNAGGDNPRYVGDYMWFFNEHADKLAFEAYFDEPHDYIRSALEDVTPDMPAIGPNAGQAYKDAIQGYMLP